MNNLDMQKKAVKSFYTDEYKSFALLYDGSLYAWGQNSSGQLGLGDEIDRNTPEKVNINGNIKQIIASSYSMSIFALMEDDSIYTWGDNGCGQLGLGDNKDRNLPEKIKIDGKVKKIIISSNSVFALMEDDSIYAWGDNKYGQLGLGDNVDKNIPSKVELNGKIKELVTHNNSYYNRVSTYALLDDNSFYSWGNNECGQLGLGDDINRNLPVKVEINGKIKKVFKDNESYFSSPYLLMEDGSVYVCGNNQFGQLGLLDIMNRNLFVKVEIQEKIKKLAGQNMRVFAITEDDSIYALTCSPDRDILSFTTTGNTPKKVELNGKVKNIIAYAPSDDMFNDTYKPAYAIMEDDSIYYIKKDIDFYEPIKIEINGKIKEVVTNIDETYAILDDGTICMWSLSGLSMIDTQEIISGKDSRYPVKKFEITGKATKIFMHENSMFAITEDGSLYAWGLNTSGQLGLGDETKRNTSEKVIFDN